MATKKATAAPRLHIPVTAPPATHAVMAPPMPAVYTMADAMALPELDTTDAEFIGAAGYEAPNERAILAFKDADGRTMTVGFTNGRLFKAAISR